MGKTPDEIRGEIEDTRDRMSDTAGAIGYKADVKTRAKDAVRDKKDAVVSKVSGAVPARETVTQGADTVKQGTRRGVRVAEQNPIGLTIGAAAVGFLVGLGLPSTRVEDERLGMVSDEVMDAARETGQEALERGKRVAQDASVAAVETARDRGSEESDELSSTLRENVQQVSTQTSPSDRP